MLSECLMYVQFTSCVCVVLITNIKRLFQGGNYFSVSSGTANIQNLLLFLVISL